MDFIMIFASFILIVLGGFFILILLNTLQDYLKTKMEAYKKKHVVRESTMKINELVERLESLKEKDPEATVHVTGYSTILVVGKGVEEPIRIG